MEKTSHTFETEAEAKAFMLGFRTAASEYNFCGIDPEEPQTILIDHGDDDAEGCYIRALEEFGNLDSA